MIDPFNVALGGLSVISLLMALCNGGAFVYELLPETPSIYENFTIIVGVWCIVHVLLALPWLYITVINPCIGPIFPSLILSDETVIRTQRRTTGYTTAFLLPFGSVVWIEAGVLYTIFRQAVVAFASATAKAYDRKLHFVKLRNYIRAKKGRGLLVRDESGTSEIPRNTTPHTTGFTAEQQAAMNRRCRKPGPVCESIRSELDVKQKRANELLSQLVEVEERELDALGALEAERNLRMRIQQRLAQTEQRLSQHDPEPNTIGQLKSQLAEFEKVVNQANLRADKAERLLRIEVENSKMIMDRKDVHNRKLREDVRKIGLNADDKMGAMRAELTLLKRKLASAIWKNAPVDVESLLAQKDATIQSLHEAVLAVEKDRDERTQFAEDMHALQQTENDHLRQQLSDATRASQATCNEADASSLTGALQQVRKAEAALDEKQTKIEELESQLQKATDTSKSALAYATHRVSILTTELSAAQKNLAAGMTKESFESINQEVEELRSQLSVAHANHTSEMNQASAINNYQQQFIASLSGDVESARSENMGLCQEISRLQELNYQHAAFNAHAEALERQLATAQQQHQTDLNQMRATAAAKNEEIKTLQESLVVRKAEISNLKEEVGDLRDYIEEQDEASEVLETKFCKALTNEKNGIKRIKELEDTRRKEATAGLLAYNRLKVEYKMACQERDNLAAGSQAGETEGLRSQLSRTSQEYVDIEKMLTVC